MYAVSQINSVKPMAQNCGFLIPLAVVFAWTGCVRSPVLQPAKPELLREGPLGFLQDGKTSREEVLLQLGTPMAQFEGERILTYAFTHGPKGEWLRIGRWDPREGRYYYLPGTCSLVLVFGTDGVLTRHSLVMSQ